MIKRILALGALALLLGVAVRVSTVPAPAVAVSADTAEEAETRGDGRPRWEEVWTRPTPAFAAMDLSPDGKAIAWVDRKGSVRYMDAQGHTLWQTAPLAYVNRVVVTPTGMVLTYAYLNPAHPTLYLLNTKDRGTSSQSCSFEGAVWEVTLSTDGRRAIVGTGQRYAYVVPLVGEKDKAFQPSARWRTPGIPESLAISASEPLALLGTWQEAGVSAFALDGTVRWRHDNAEPTRQYRVHLSEDGNTAVGVSATGPHDSEARVDVWDADSGHLLWTEMLEGFHPKALTTRGGEFIAVTYSKTLSQNSAEKTERKLALYNRQGQRLWEKGGFIFSPELVALAANGSRLTVTDGVNTLYTLDAHGHTISRLRLRIDPSTGAPPTIKEISATEDGSYLLVRRGDGQISLLKAT